MLEEKYKTPERKILNDTRISEYQQTKIVQNLHKFSPFPMHKLKIHRKIYKSNNISNLIHNNPYINYRFLNQTKNIKTLGQWLRQTTISLGLGRQVFHSAFRLLQRYSSDSPSTYLSAAAALTLIAKYEEQRSLYGVHQLPLKNIKQPIVPLKAIAQAEYQMLKSIDFNIELTKKQFFYECCTKWTLYVKYNIKHLDIPFDMLETGINGKFQIQNTISAGYMMDVIKVLVSHLQNDDLIILTASFVTVAARNSGRTSHLDDPYSILFRYGKGFMRKCYKRLQQQKLRNILQVIRVQRLWQKLGKVPFIKRQISVNASQEDQIQWLDKLDPIAIQDH